MKPHIWDHRMGMLRSTLNRHFKAIAPITTFTFATLRGASHSFATLKENVGAQPTLQKVNRPIIDGLMVQAIYKDVVFTYQDVEGLKSLVFMVELVAKICPYTIVITFQS